ncbi:MAG: AAA family ATPase [Oscillospiraceae bacterium]|nr:AAA family ATPase [Oscillospiraceae bacterium]
MPEFVARVSVEPDYALERLSQWGAYFQSIFAAIPAKYRALPVMCRFTFGLVRLTAPDMDRCCMAIEAAAGSVPVRVLPVPYEEGDRGELMTEVLGGLFGVPDYQRLCCDIYTAAPILASNGALSALCRQSILLAIDPGCGYTTLVSSMGNFLRRIGAYEDQSEARSKYDEFKIALETGGEYIAADDLLDKFQSGYCNDCGTVGIDISWFLSGEKDDLLRSFLQRLRRYQEEIVMVFRVPFLEKNALDRVTELLEDVMLLQVVQVPPLHNAVLAELLWDRLRAMGLDPDMGIFDLFFSRLLREKSDGRFYGFVTAEKLADEMVLKKAFHDARVRLQGGNPDTARLLPWDLDEGFAAPVSQKDGYAELGELIGMEEIAARVREIVAQVKLAMKDEKLDRPCIHMRFVGHPGTGKTTVARIIGRIFRQEGILRKGGFMEYSARSLCAEYVGQTAVRTASICRDAYGSVLFIDEAYALYEGDTHTADYGKEALTTLISEMENHRDDMLVIMAGYTEDMDTLMEGNAGLRSRMPYLISFPSYTRRQLFEIYMLMVRKHFGYTAGLESAAKEYFESLSEDYIQSKEFANARFVRNLYERTWSKGALRAALAGRDSIELTAEDFLAASAEKEFSEKLMKKKARVGF